MKKLSIQHSRLQDIIPMHGPLDAMETARTEPTSEMSRSHHVLAVLEPFVFFFPASRFSVVWYSYSEVSNHLPDLTAGADACY